MSMVNRVSRFIGVEDKGTSVKVEFCTLCDYCDRTERDLINIYGGCIHALNFIKLPEERPLVLLLSVGYGIKDIGSHIVEVRMIDYYGNDKMCPIMEEVCFSGGVLFHTFDIKLSPTFYQYEMLSVVVMLDGVWIKSVPLNIQYGR